MTKKIPRYDMVLAVGKGASLWTQPNPDLERCVLYTANGFILIEISDETKIEIIRNKRVYRRVFKAPLSHLKATVEARRFQRYLVEQAEFQRRKDEDDQEQNKESAERYGP